MSHAILKLNIYVVTCAMSYVTCDMDGKNEFVYVGIECIYCPDLIDI